jgi:hypothetical protein
VAGSPCRKTLNTTIRPLLAEVPLSVDAIDNVTFPAPGRVSRQVAAHTLYFRRSDDLLQCSVPFRNIGTGTAVIAGAHTEPHVDRYHIGTSRIFVPHGERVRVNISAPGGLDYSSSEPAIADRQPGEFVVAIEYSDENGHQERVTRAYISTFATSGTQVRRMSIGEKGRRKPVVMSGTIEYGVST